MLDTIDNKIEKVSNRSVSISKFRDEILNEYYSHYFNSLSSKEFDKEFNKDLALLIKSLTKLPQEDRSMFINTLSKFIEFYIESKVEKELDKSFHKIFNFL